MAFPAAPPRSEPGSGSRLPSGRWAAAERMVSWVSGSLVIGGPLRGRSGTIPRLLPPRAARLRQSEQRSVAGDHQVGNDAVRAWWRRCLRARVGSFAQALRPRRPGSLPSV